MNIGFVTTWLERGATYVSKTYMNLLNDEHNTFVYARGGEKCLKGSNEYDLDYVTWGLRLGETRIDWKHFSKWIKKNSIDMIIFNEQKDIITVAKTKINYPNIKLGAYIDYYTEETVPHFKLYDFLLCNTKRHHSVFEWHKNAHFIPWGTNLKTFTFTNEVHHVDEITFFHSVGMSNRKGTDFLVNAFISGKFYNRKAKLILHTQIKLDHIISKSDADKYNIEIIMKEVAAPGLYHLGDVYVYPTTLDGLGLTIYEALACGLPVITTDCAPMNEIINNNNGVLVEVEKYRTRKDGYYWPLSIVSEKSLIDAMRYYCDNREHLTKFRSEARIFSEDKLNIDDRKTLVNKIVNMAEVTKIEDHELKIWIKRIKDKDKDFAQRVIVESILPNWIKHSIRNRMEKNRSEISK